MGFKRFRIWASTPHEKVSRPCCAHASELMWKCEHGDPEKLFLASIRNPKRNQVGWMSAQAGDGKSRPRNQF